MRLRKIAIKGYRRLEDVTVDLEGLSVLIGPNGVGKSTFLDVLTLLAEAMNGNLSTGIANRGGVARIRSRFVAPTITFCLESTPVAWPKNDGSSPLIYEVELGPSERGYRIAKERLVQQRDQPKPFLYIQRSADEVLFSDPTDYQLKKPTWGLDPTELALAQVPRNYPDPEAFRASLANTRAYRPVVLEAASPMRLPQTLRPNVSFPSPSGDDLLSALYQLRLKHPTRFERLVDAIRAGFGGGLQKLDFEPVAAGQFSLTWHEAGFADTLFAHELSSGTLRFLHLGTLLLSPNLPELMVLDEPELSFHPELLRIFCDLLSDAAERTQLVVATHSAPLVRWLEPKQVVVAQHAETGTALVRGDALHLEKWLEKYTLDQLWQMNVIEGRQ